VHAPLLPAPRIVLRLDKLRRTEEHAGGDRAQQRFEAERRGRRVGGEQSEAGEARAQLLGDGLGSQHAVVVDAVAGGPLGGVRGVDGARASVATVRVVEGGGGDGESGTLCVSKLNDGDDDGGDGVDRKGCFDLLLHPLPAFPAR